ncbi:enoyl-CoA hydratase [Oryzicola mucosus]|uniref:Enoyl-CoA hydratase n=1 Tax=Oryzicola mucosus TaxID=2767425 RepID=A0A8J6PMN1_9HYPH|nr:enoyl-CoA hydratase [Oryzicola mucosus]MBD0417078.1 enoyl-CoA hydratase [Oryzicola mucosus]
MEFTQVKLQVEAGVATVSLDRPDRMNGVTAVMERELYAAMRQADADPQVRVIVLTGEGRAFCAGMDMAELEDLAPEDIYEPAKMRPFDTAIRADFQSRYIYFPALVNPVISAINGAAAGLGIVFALASDMRFASEKAVFSTAFSRRGLIAEHGIAWLMLQTAGPGVTADLLFSARRFDAGEAKSAGLIDRIYPPDELMARTLDYARELASLASPRSVRVMKRQLWDARFQNLQDVVTQANREMIESFRSEDFQEGVRHFLEKRSPVFTGH